MIPYRRPGLTYLPTSPNWRRSLPRSWRGGTTWQAGDEVQANKADLSAQLAQLEAIASAQTAQLEKLTASFDAVKSSRDAQHAQVVEMLRLVHDGTQGYRGQVARVACRRHLHERAYSEPNPLVSILIATYDNYQLLRDRAIPSVLTRKGTYQKLRVSSVSLVAGHAAPDEARVAVESFADPPGSLSPTACTEVPPTPQTRAPAGSSPARPVYREGLRLCAGTVDRSVGRRRRVPAAPYRGGAYSRLATSGSSFATVRSRRAPASWHEDDARSLSA